MHDIEEGRRENTTMRSERDAARTERDTLRTERDTLRTERDALRTDCEDQRKNAHAYDELVANKDAEMAAMRKQVAAFEKGKEDELDRLKTKLIEMGDQVNNALKFQEVSYFSFLSMFLLFLLFVF